MEFRKKENFQYFKWYKKEHFDFLFLLWKSGIPYLFCYHQKLSKWPWKELLLNKQFWVNKTCSWKGERKDSFQIIFRCLSNFHKRTWKLKYFNYFQSFFINQIRKYNKKDKKNCAVRESNPGPENGNLGW